MASWRNLPRLAATPAAAATVTDMPARRDGTPKAGRPDTSSPEQRALRARLVADDRATTAMAGQSRLEAICSSLASHLVNHDVQPYLLATLGKTRHPVAGQPREYAVSHGTAWDAAGFYLSPGRPFLLEGGPGTAATATCEALSVTRYVTTLAYRWRDPVPAGLGETASPALVLERSPVAVRVRGVLHTRPGSDVERDAVGAGTWYVRDEDTTILLHDTGNGLVLRDLERDLVRRVAVLTAWWNH